MTAEHEEQRPEESSPPAPAAEPEAKVIKRYSNRKLYDTGRSRYVTLEEIAEMIRAGEHVRVIDNRTKSDLTSATLAQIIFETEKRESHMPLDMLRNLIQSGGATIQDIYDRSVQRSVELRQSADKLRQAATRSVQDLTGQALRVFNRSNDEPDAVARRVEAIARRYEGAFEELRKRLEGQIEEAAADLDVVEPLASRLEARVDEVLALLEALRAASKDGG